MISSYMGWDGIEHARFIARSPFIVVKVNQDAWLLIISWRKPIRENISTNPSAVVVMSMEGRGTASRYLEEKSTGVSMYPFPLDEAEDRRPIRTDATCLKGLSISSVRPTGGLLSLALGKVYWQALNDRMFQWISCCNLDQ